jgi:PIN like domain
MSGLTDGPPISSAIGYYSAVTKDDATESDRNKDRPSESVSENTGDGRGIFTGQFEIYRTATEDDYRAVLTSGLIVLDTSALLDLYRYHAKTREELIQVLSRLRGRAWVPNHAMYEFFENRLGVIDNHSEELNKAIGDLNGYRTALDGAIRATGTDW